MSVSPQGTSHIIGISRAGGDVLQLVVFHIDDLRCAVELASVERIVRAVAVTALPTAPSAILGVIDVAGQVMPVVSLRHRLSLPARAIDPSHLFAIVRVSARTLAFVVDSVEGVIDAAASELVPAADLAPAHQHVQGVVQLAGDLILLQDLQRVLSPDEMADLDRALAGARAAGG